MHFIEELDTVNCQSEYIDLQEDQEKEEKEKRKGRKKGGGGGRKGKGICCEMRAEGRILQDSAMQCNHLQVEQ